jgi:hypothetical protein
MEEILSIILGELHVTWVAAKLDVVFAKSSSIVSISKAIPAPIPMRDYL